jgi:hypothetical protein
VRQRRRRPGRCVQHAVSIRCSAQEQVPATPQALNLIKAGYDLTVWNRSADKCDNMAAGGAKAGRSPARAQQRLGARWRAGRVLPASKAQRMPPDEGSTCCWRVRRSHRRPPRWSGSATSPLPCCPTRPQRSRSPWVRVPQPASAAGRRRPAALPALPASAGRLRCLPCVPPQRACSGCLRRSRRGRVWHVRRQGVRGRQHRRR